MGILKKILEIIFGLAMDYIWGIIEFSCRFLLYPFFAVALYKLSVRENLKKPVLSIIPIYNMIYIAKIIKNLYVFNKCISGKALSVLLVICAFLRNPLIDKIPIIGDLISGISIVFFFFYVLALQRLWEMYTPKSADSFLALATLFPIIIPFLVFAIRNKQQVSSQMLIDYNSDGMTDEVITIHNTAQNNERNILVNRTVLSQESAPLWFSGCPIIINRQEILSLGNTDFYLGLTIQNLFPDVIKAVYMDIQCFDYLQRPLQGISDCKLIDLSIERNQRFSTDMDIALPDVNTRKCVIMMKQIAFADSGVWNNDNAMQFVQISAPVRIQYKPELLRLMSSRLKGRSIPSNQYLFQPITTPEYWFCGCGQFNTNQDNDCRNCHISKDEVFKIIDEKNLQEDYNQMMQEKLQHNLERKEERQQERNTIFDKKHSADSVGVPIIMPHPHSSFIVEK